MVPVRAQASECAEMCTEMLFCDTAEVLEKKARWTRICTDADNYEGWVDSKMIIDLSDDEFRQVNDSFSSATYRVKLPVAFALSIGNGQTIPLAASTRLPNYKDGTFEILGAHFNIDPAAVTATLTFNEETFLEVSRFFLNAPYLWGGKSLFGMDCSGLTQVLFSLFGINLPRNASQQVEHGEIVDFLAEGRVGDLAFFDHGDNGKITHVGILLDNQRIMHCSGRVKIERIDPNGIISIETGQYTHNRRVIKRLTF